MSRKEVFYSDGDRCIKVNRKYPRLRFVIRNFRLDYDDLHTLFRAIDLFQAYPAWFTVCRILFNNHRQDKNLQ